MDIIEIRNINKSYGENRVLNDISLKVAKGEVVSIIGPSGSGKSTLLRSIADLETVDSGSILIEGYDITEKSMDKKEKKKILLKTGMVFQNFNLFPHMTVRNNIARTLKVVKKASAKEADEITKQMLAKVGLIDKIDNYPNELSGGQKQRVGIARALANRFTALADQLAEQLPPAYPTAYDAGKALHAAAKARGEHGFGAQWAGQGAPLSRPMPAAELVAQLAAELSLT